MGNLLRQYWMPLLHSTDVPDNDAPPQRIRILGENLIVFRTAAGEIGLLDHSCPHRQASLFYGRNEENGIRCVYHGWKFNVGGECVDMPNEPSARDFKHRVKAVAYPCREVNGIIWAYMGPAKEPPPLPQVGWAMVSPAHRGSLKYQRACNWVQALEGDMDSSHLGFLHRISGTPEDEWPYAGAADDPDHYRSLVAGSPDLDVIDTEIGVTCAAKRRGSESGAIYWRVSCFLLPFFTSVPGSDNNKNAKIWVPLDDHHTMVWETPWSNSGVFTPEEQTGREGRIGSSGFLPDTSDWLGRCRLAANAGNDYFIDRNKQKNDNFSGLEDVPPIQDSAVQESMSAIVDRSREHLGPSDMAIIGLRRKLVKAATDLRDHDAIPPGVEQPELFHRHGEQMLLHENDDWREVYSERMSRAYAGGPSDSGSAGSADAS
jgi:phenylpropionate dioxygenase-like ring-hydroxylating dioxygenase large terminal subunit